MRGCAGSVVGCTPQRTAAKDMQADVGVQVRKACLLDYRIPREAQLDLRLLKNVDEDSFRPNPTSH
jgi:hypothetical protein